MKNDRNDSILFFTSDQNYVIKTISKKERIVFIKHLLNSYSTRIFECPDSKLVRILGVFKIVFSKISFCIMENTTPETENSLIFDLKGSSVDRCVKVRNQDFESQVLKDENFRIMDKKVKMGKQELKNIKKILNDDIFILKEIGIMDYSLLLVINTNKISGNRYCLNNHYSVAVIDFFTLYDNYKAAERWYKIYIRRVNRNLISVMSPVEYYQRLLKFISNIFIEQEELELSYNFK